MKFYWLDIIKIILSMPAWIKYQHMLEISELWNMYVSAHLTLRSVFGIPLLSVWIKILNHCVYKVQNLINAEPIKILCLLKTNSFVYCICMQLGIAE